MVVQFLTKHFVPGLKVFQVLKDYFGDFSGRFGDTAEMSFWPPQKNCSYYGRSEERAWMCSPDTQLLREGGRKPGGCEAAVNITWCMLHLIDRTACLWLLSPQLPCEPQVWGKEVVCSRLRRKPGKAAGTEDTPEKLSLIALGKQNIGLFWSCAAGCLGVWKLAEWKE